MIINSLLDTDLYKFTMMQVVLHRFPSLNVEYKFQCRNAAIDLSPYLNEINKEIDHLCTLRFNEEELDYLSRIRYIRNDFIDFLRIFQLNRKFIQVDIKNNKFEIKIKGPWLHTIFYEVPVLAIVNEVYFRNIDPNPDIKNASARLDKKIELVKNNREIFKFADFGTRRRRSMEWHEIIIKKLKSELPQNFIGTSNVYFAMKYKLTPVGTMAHEFLQACQALGVRLVDSQKFAFENWVQEYRGDLGIALSDVVGMDAFFRDFDLYFCKLFDGARHDSGDPYEWCDKLLLHYKKHNIDPKTKTAVFSDGLNFESALNIVKKYHDSLRIVCGIGTNLTNDFNDDALQIVIKMTRCNDQPVAKISDSPGKAMCEDESYVKYLKNVFQIKK